MTQNAPAFARPHSVDTGGDYPWHNDAQAGLTTREYFAAAALTGLLTNPNGSLLDVARVAQLAVAHADAMLMWLAEGGEQ